MSCRGVLSCLLAVLTTVAACNRPQGPSHDSSAEPVTSGPTTGPIDLVDVTAERGVAFVHDNGASPRRYLPETMGSGVALFDADGDGDVDLYFPNGRSIANPGAPASPAAFYRNRGDGTFYESAVEAGLAEPFYGLGTATGDLDNDGDLDLYVSGLGGDRLFRNRGDGRFEEAGAELGLGSPGFGSSGAFVDIDRDGFLDLFAGRYVRWSREDDLRCSPDGEHATYCTPELYEGESNRLYRNLEGRRLADVTAAAGIEQPKGKTLGVLPLDLQGDGWPDILVANDTWRNALYVNRADGTFRDEAVELGVAFSLSGATRGAMGVDAGDLSHRGHQDLVIGNFSQEMAAIYRPSQHGFYSDDAAQLGVGLPTLMTLAFGTLVADLDSDGWLDLVLANGHIEPEVAQFQPLQSYAQPLQLFRNLGAAGGFEAVAGGPGSALTTPWVGRGLAAADLEGDGDLDLVLTQNGRAARLFENRSPGKRWLRVQLVGRRSNRTGYGAVVTAVVGAERIARTLRSGRSYLSASEPLVTFGLGSAERVDRLEVRWPSGAEQHFLDPPLDRVLTIEEPAS